MKLGIVDVVSEHINNPYYHEDHWCTSYSWRVADSLTGGCAVNATTGSDAAHMLMLAERGWWSSYGHGYRPECDWDLCEILERKWWLRW